jgi:hypothetical protein
VTRFAKRGRALEAEYFRKREQELIEKLRRRAAAEAELHRLGEQAGVADEESCRTCGISA